jgi:outer membrane protein OmpA-like peptidoglycan-associated protein
MKTEYPIYRIAITIGSFLLLTTGINAQKKSDLMAQIASLQTELQNTKALVSEAQKNEKISLAKAESFETQVLELQDANATLLKNLNSFAMVSSKNSDNINKTLASLEDKERQLKSIKDAIASNDSTALVVLTNAKQTLGENVKIAVSNGSLVISESLETLFGNEAKSVVTPQSEDWLGKIAGILNANPSMSLTVEGLSMTGNLGLATQQASSVAGIIQTKYGIDPKRITALGKDGNFKEGVNLKIHPSFEAFYLMTREKMKNGNKG